MEALILAAGLGTRLRPLTNDRPKALVEVAGATLLERTILHLADFGYNRIVVNIHHFPSLMEQYIRSRKWPAEIIISDESGLLLDTGGALAKAAPFFTEDNILIHNVDILHTIDLDALREQHIKTNSIATLAVSQRNTSRQLIFDNNLQLQGWQNKLAEGNTCEKDSNRQYEETRWVTHPIPGYKILAFSGITIASRTLFSLLPAADHPYPIIPEYLKLAKNHRISAFIHPAEQWLDVGKPETLSLAETFIKEHNAHGIISL